MKFADKLKELRERATPPKWFKRYCDDDNHMCMTVISSKDYGPKNTGQFKDETDTVAITFHQLMPAVGEPMYYNDATTDLIVFLANHAKEIEALVEKTNKLIAYIGAHGEISRNKINEIQIIDAVLDALAAMEDK